MQKQQQSFLSTEQLCSIQLVFLEPTDGGKAFRKREVAHGEFQAIQWPFSVTSHTKDVDSIQDLAIELNVAAQAGMCMIKGPKLVKDRLFSESRSGQIDTKAYSNLLVLDLDDVEYPGGIEKLMCDMMPGVGYAYHYSSSQEFDEQGRPAPGFPIRGHVFVRLRNHVAPSVIKSIIKQINLDLGTVSLNHRDSLKYHIDLCMADNTRIVLIQPPKLLGDPESIEYQERVSRYEVKCVVPEGCDGRITYFDPKKYVQKTTTTLKYQETRVLNNIRALHGLPDREVFKMKRVTAPESEPEYDDIYSDKPRVIGHRVMSGFIANPTPQNLQISKKYSNEFAVYLEPVGTTEYDKPTKLWMCNKRRSGFVKDWRDPDYVVHLSDLCRPLWVEIQAMWNVKVMDDIHQAALIGEKKTRYEVFRDFNTGRYTGVIIKAENGTVETRLTPLGTKEHIKDFYASNQVVNPSDMVTDAEFGYLPTEPSGVLARGSMVLVNTYVGPTIPPIDTFDFEDYAQVPRAIDFVVRHVMGGHPEHTERFYDWWAHIIQTGERTNSAWIIRGVGATGKGVLKHLFEFTLGQDNVADINKDSFAEKYSDAIDNKQLVILNEMRTKGSQIDSTHGNGDADLMEKCKHLIDVENLTVRRMYEGARKSKFPNPISLMSFSNREYSMALGPNDQRKFFVPPFQHHALLVDNDTTPFRAMVGEDPALGRYDHDEFLEMLKREAHKMYYYLKLVRKYDYGNVNTPIFSDDKRAMIEASATNDLSKPAGALRTGRILPLVDTVPDHLNALSQAKPRVGTGRGVTSIEDKLVSLEYAQTLFALSEHVLRHVADPYVLPCTCCGTLNHVDAQVYNSKVLSNAKSAWNKRVEKNNVLRINAKPRTGEFETMVDPNTNKSGEVSMWDVLEWVQATSPKDAAGNLDTYHIKNRYTVPFPGYDTITPTVVLANHIEDLSSTPRVIKRSWQCANPECTHGMRQISTGRYKFVYKDHGVALREYPWELTPQQIEMDMFDGEIFFPMAASVDVVATLLAGNARNPRTIAELISINPTVKQKAIKATTGGLITPRPPKRSDGILPFDARAYLDNRVLGHAEPEAQKYWGVPRVAKTHYYPIPITIDYGVLVETYDQLLEGADTWSDDVVI